MDIRRSRSRAACNIQFGKDSKDNEWIKDNDLELVAEAEENT